MLFRKRIKIMPGVNINISKSGFSTTVGAKGFSVNSGKNGAYLNTGLPGTGIYNRTKLSGNASFNNETNEYVYEVKSKATTGIICFFFGFLGVHRFYTGHIGFGILQLFTLGGFFLWTFIDFILIVTGNFKDSEGNFLV